MKLHQLLICCAFIFSANADESVQPYDIWEDTERLYVQLQNIVNTAINTAISETSTLSTQLITFSQRVSSDAQTQIRGASQGVRNQLRNLELLATALDREYCMRGVDIEIDFVTEQLIADTRECIYEVASEGVGVINNISLTITRAQLKVDDIGERMDECRLIDNEDCIIFLKTEIQLSIDELPTAILDDTLEVLLLNRDWTATIQNCADHRVGLIYTEGNRIVFDVETCLTQPATTAAPPPEKSP